MKIKTKLFAGLALSALVINPAYAQDSGAAEGATDDDAIVVTGIRGSLERGVAVKRNADTIVDAISAEELGKFPDTNVAESLQRITGVAITRDRGGEGRFVTVRGLDQDFNLLTYNGRRLATENAGREFSFDVIASELISAAQVYKSPTASLSDGAIGGLVNIQTAKPFDNPGFQFAGSVAGQYESLSEEIGLQASGVISSTFADDTFGILASIAYQERSIRTDTAESIAIDSSTDFNLDGVNDRLNSFNANLNQEERERIGGTLVFQFRPSDDVEITLDGLYTSFDSPAISTSYSYFPNPALAVATDISAPAAGFADSASTFSDVLDQTTVAPAGSPFDNIFDYVARRAEQDTETYQFGGNLDWQASDTLNVELDLSYSRASGVRDNTGTDLGGGSFFVVSFPGLAFGQDTTGNRVPDITAQTLQNVNIAGSPLVDINQVDPAGARLHFSRNSSNEIEDEIFSAKIDLDWEFDDDTSIAVGFEFVDRSKGNQVFDNNATFCGDTGTPFALNDQSGNAFICNRGIGFADLLSPVELGTLLTPFNGTQEGFLSGTDANIPRDFFLVNIATVEQAFANFGTILGQPSFLTPSFNASQSNVVDETLFNGYVEANIETEFAGIPVQVNTGVRLVYTDLTSSGANADLISVTLDGVSGNNVIAEGPPVAVSSSNDYFEILPSFNASFDFSDQIKGRIGFSRSLARPTFNALTTAFAVTQINSGQETTAGGNPNLDPVTALNFDASLEYYGDNGLTLSAAVFYKDLSNVINNDVSTLALTIPESFDAAAPAVPLGPVTINFQNSGPLNGDTAEVYGLELGGQFVHDSGFGIQGNVTFADSNSTAAGITAPLENISDLSYNGSIFFENYGFQAQFSVSHRGDFLSSTQGEGGFAEITDSFTQFDLSASYDFGESTGIPVTLFVEGINIFDEPFFIFSENTSFLEEFIENGSRWQAGLRVKF